MRSCFVLCVVIAVSGCSSAPTIVIPTTEFTEEQRLAIAREDAEVCNCGKDTHNAHASEQED